MKKSLSIIVAAFFLLCDTLHAQDVPRIVSYQGVLVDANGKPITSSPQNPVKIKFEIINSSNQLIKDIGTESAMTVVGGLFTRPLDLSGIPQNDLNQQLFLRLTVNDGTPYPPIPLYSTISALNIPDNVVTSQKIKDGEVKSQDLDAMGATVDGQTLVYRAGAWRAETQVVPLTIPVGTVMAYMGDGTDLSALQSNGWYLCDNRQISTLPGLTSQEKTDLINIFTRAGNPSPGNLPDLRGMFLRGADDRTVNNADPDFNKRSGSGKKIGSGQGDSVGRHTHNLRIDNGGEHNHRLFLTARTQEGSNGVTGGSTDNGDDGHAGKNAIEPSGLHTHSGYAEENSGSETRPKNVYVNYIIKAR